MKRGATAITEPHDLTDENGTVRHAAIATYGDTIHSFFSIQHEEQRPQLFSGPFLPGFEAQEVEGESTGIMIVDQSSATLSLAR